MIKMKVPLEKMDMWVHTAVGLPSELVMALSHNGVMEIKGAKHSVDIMSWAKQLGILGWYPNDETAWCGVFKGINALRAGWIGFRADVASAISWLRWGNEIALTEGCVGDTVIFERFNSKGVRIGGHVAYLLGYSSCGRYMRIFGGNQSDKVCAAWKSVDTLVGIRRAIWKTSQPAGVVRHVYLPTDLPKKLQFVSES